jgi:hypothetical protein
MWRLPLLPVSCRCACALLVLITAAAAAPAAAQQVDVLTGRITTMDGSPLEGARVEALSLQTELSRSVITDRNGRYMLLFADASGAYLVRISYIGYTEVLRPLLRERGEELLLLDVVMEPQVIALDAINVEALNLNPDAVQAAGEQGTELSIDLLSRLPLPDLEANTLAQLVAGVIATAEDSVSGRTGFSVGGMSDQLNQVTLDGTVMGEGGLGVPQEGVSRTQVTTSTFDASRGGFAGGQIAMTSARGGNRNAGAVSYTFDGDALQATGAASATPFTRHNVNGAWGGPLVPNRLFYNVSTQVQRNINHMHALAVDDPLAAQRSGVHADSIGRFLSILNGQYGFPIEGETGQYNQYATDLRLQARIDWNAVQKPKHTQALSLRLNQNTNLQDSTRIRPTSLAQYGGDSDRDSRLAAFTLTSRMGGTWTHTLNGSFNEEWSDLRPFMELPEGVVRVTSRFEDGTRDSRQLVFGGNRSMPQEAYSRNVQLSNELSLVRPIAGQVHRMKLGASLQRTRSIRRDTDNLFGTFIFSSLAEFEANRPDRFERVLTERQTRTGRTDAAFHFGDTWRFSQPLELTLGLRWERSRLDQRPDHNPDVEAVFGRRTDIEPVATTLSPRVGFNYRISPQGSPMRAINGGIGLFAGRAPTNIFATAARQTGMPNAEQRLICIGESVPAPDWDLYLSDPGAIPTACADGGPGSPPAHSTRAPNVTLIDPDQTMPSSLRADVGYRTQLPLRLNGNFRYVYSLGFGLWGYRDMNLDETRSFMIGIEERPFFGEPSAIVSRTGSTAMTTSRRHREFGNVYDVVSDRRSISHQLSATVNGTLPPKLSANATYTLGFARDQGSGSFAAATTADNPNVAEWSDASNDRRHTLNLTLTYPVKPYLEIAVMPRIMSGTPFTPLVDRDINGDGNRNDRAYIFDPTTAQDTAVAAGMLRLLDNVTPRVRSCLETQYGRIADRNSCRNPWGQQLNMRINFRPELPTLSRRMTMSVDARNLISGVDQLVHGRTDMRGWGAGRPVENLLLRVRGFNATARTFRYEVNEGFGQARRGVQSFSNPFTVTLSGRIAMGNQPSDNRPFGVRGPGMGGGGGGARAPLSDSARARMAAGRSSPVSIVDRVLANPLPVLLALSDTLGFTPEQVADIEALSEALTVVLNARRLELGKRFDGVPAAEQGALLQQIQPDLERARTEVRQALARVQEILTPEQWARVPARVRDPYQTPTQPQRRDGGGATDDA